MAYDPNSPLDATEQAHRSNLFTVLQNLLHKIGAFAQEYSAVVAEGYSATIPTLGVSTLVSIIRQKKHLPEPSLGRIKSWRGPQTVYPDISLRPDNDPGRCLLVTELVNRGDKARRGLLQLREVLPAGVLTDVAVMADMCRNGVDVITDVQRPGERIIIGGCDFRSVTAGNYLWGAEEMTDDMKSSAVELGQAVAERFLNS